MSQYQFNCTIFHNTRDNLEVANYARLLCLVVEQGTECMKKYVLSHLPYPPKVNSLSDADVHEENSLSADVSEENRLRTALAIKKNHFKHLKKKDKINNATYKLLYPPYGGPINLEKFDMSLWYKLARNLAVDEHPVKYNDYEKNPPLPHENLPQHNVVRIRNMRNTLFHLDTPQLKGDMFDSMWREISRALQDLGVQKDTIDGYQLRNLDPSTTINHYIQLREEVREEYESLYKAELQKRKLFMIGLVVVAIILICVSLVSSYILYIFTGTWKSCIHSMNTILTNGGAISIMPRNGWKAQHPRHQSAELKIPLEYVIISHTAVTGRCSTTDDCCNTAQITQRLGFFKGWDDVAYNYMVGNDGVIYEGRGRLKAATSGPNWNNRSIGIGFLGKYIFYPPTDDALDVMQLFLQYLVDTGVLTHNFTLYGLCQVQPFPDAPGAALYNIIKQWQGDGGINTWRWRSRPGSTCNTNVTYTDLK